MRIAFIVNSFPNLSETFILNQVIELIKRGHDVKVYSLYKGNIKQHNLYKEHNLKKNVQYIFNESEQNKLKRVLYFPILFFKKNRKIKYKKLLETFNFRKYGSSSFSLMMAYAYLRILETKNFDVIHCQFGPLGLFGMKLKKLGLLRGKLFTSFRGYDTTARIKRNPNIYNELYEYGDGFLPVSQSLKKRLIENGCPAEKIKVYYSG